MKNASKAVSEDMTVQKAATTYGINCMTLKRFIEKQKSGDINNGMPIGYTVTVDAHRVSTDQMEIDLSNHIKNFSNIFHGISSNKVQELAYKWQNPTK